MTVARFCCCGANPPKECLSMCDYATSYAMTNLSGSVSWNRTFTGALCGPCTDYDGPVVAVSSQVVINITQVYNQTLVRTATEGGGCCYRVAGTLRFAWSFVISSDYTCCEAHPNPVCNYTVGDSGTTDVSFCLTAVCAGDWNNGDAWTWTLTTCGFACGDYEVLDFGPLDCQYGYDCVEPPLRTSRIVIGPSKYVWKSKMMSPGSLVNTTDVVGLGFCEAALPCGSPVSGTDPTSTNSSCMPNQVYYNDINGPFALSFASAIGSLPAECLNSYGSGSSITPDHGAQLPPVTGWCPGQIDYSDDCNDLTMNDYWIFPDFS